MLDIHLDSRFRPSMMPKSAVSGRFRSDQRVASVTVGRPKTRKALYIKVSSPCRK